MKKIKAIISILIIFLVSQVFGQEIISYSGNDNYTLVERTNLRRYDNGKYSGLMSREVRSFLTQKKTRAGNIFYYGDFFIEQDTVQNSKVMFTGIHEAIPSSFYIDECGAVTMEEDNGYPSFRSFPSFPKISLAPGDTWKGTSSRAIDPLNNGIITKIPMTVQYTFEGKEIYHNEEVFRISAQWATRYGISYWDFGGDKNLKSAQGSHKASILVSCETGAMIFMTDTVDETFIYTDGKSVAYKGTILQFTEYPTSVSHEEILPALKRIGAVSISDSNAVSKSDTLSGSNKSSDFKTNSNTTSESDIVSNSKNKNYSDSSNTTDSSRNADFSKYDDSIISEKNLTSDLGPNKITVTETDAGIRLAIHDLKFKADSAELMPGESSRLDEIASVLKLSGNNKLLIEGHTADTGYKEGEQKVSNDRAHAIAQELSKRGINADRLICKGLGASRPIADNSTPEGKALNRRVEITILERNK